MTNKQKVWAVVPAAGSGQRFGSQLPKQYSSLLTKTIFDYSLEALLGCGVFSGVVVALAENDSHFESLSAAKDSRIIKTIGGASRAESVLSGLNALEDIADAGDWVMVHDAARPLLRSSRVEELANLLTSLSCEHEGAILARPVADTLKSQQYKGEDGLAKVVKTVSREGLWAAQTPQAFGFKHLLKSLKELAIKDRLGEVTDEASAIELMGGRVHLMQGDASNFKITTQEDLELAEAYLKQRENPL